MKLERVEELLDGLDGLRRTLGRKRRRKYQALLAKYRDLREVFDVVAAEAAKVPDLQEKVENLTALVAWLEAERDSARDERDHALTEVDHMRAERDAARVQVERAQETRCPDCGEERRFWRGC